MSWHFSQALEAEYLAASCSGGEPSAPWNSMPFAPDDSCSGKMKDTSHRSPFGTMFVPSTDTHGEAVLTWFLEGFRAKTFHAPEVVRDSRESGADCGEKCGESLARFSLVTRSWKTRQCSLFGGSESYSENWPRWGMVRGTEYSPLPTLAHPTSASGFGYLPTPRRSGQSRAFKAYRRKNYQGNLEEFLGRIGYAGWINPSFSENAMMWPLGWSSTAPLETGKIQQWLDSHGEPSPENRPSSPAA